MTINGPIIRDGGGGTNQSGLRDLNARLVLSFVRRNGGMSSAEIARHSGLSAQTVSNILRKLVAERLVKKGKTVKGKIGKPFTPIELNPDGVYSIGVNIGRRSAEIVLVDFVGTPIAAQQTTYSFPEIGPIFDFIRIGCRPRWQ